MATLDLTVEELRAVREGLMYPETDEDVEETIRKVLDKLDTMLIDEGGEG